MRMDMAGLNVVTGARQGFSAPQIFVGLAAVGYCRRPDAWQTPATRRGSVAAALLDPVPLQRTAAPVFFDGLVKSARTSLARCSSQSAFSRRITMPSRLPGETGCAWRAPVRATAFRSTGPACRHGTVANPMRRPVVAPLGAPELAGAAVVHIEQQPPVGQRGVVERVAGGAPFTKRHQVGAQRIKQLVFVRGEPGAEPGKLAMKGLRQILPAVLRAQHTVRRHRKSQVGAIELFFQHHLAGQQLLRSSGESLVVAWRAGGQPRNVRACGKGSQSYRAFPFCVPTPPASRSTNSLLQAHHPVPSGSRASRCRWHWWRRRCQPAARARHHLAVARSVTALADPRQHGIAIASGRIDQTSLRSILCIITSQP